ncbi:hypothetical protein [Peribacillus butanolivorans]|uniref:hypothetical protein n=1 Tax=Peribacillus butanolivorans TaxID=421767 RepID=UPI00366ADBA6
MQLESIKLSTSVQKALERANLEMLPKEIKSDELFEWLFQFTSPLDILNNLDIESNRNRYRENLLMDSISRMVRNSLAVSLNYYFTSIFIIGRQMKVSGQKIDSIYQSLTISALENTFKQNEDLIFENHLINESYDLENIKKDFIIDLKRVLEDVLDIQNFNFDVAWELWNLWKFEVKTYKDMLEKSSYYLEMYLSERATYREKERMLSHLIDFSAYEFVQLPLHGKLYKSGYRSQVSYDEVFAENLYLFTNILHQMFPLSESNDHKHIHESLYKRYFFKLTGGLKKLKVIKKSRGKFK